MANEAEEWLARYTVVIIDRVIQLTRVDPLIETSKRAKFPLQTPISVETVNFVRPKTCRD